MLVQKEGAFEVDLPEAVPSPRTIEMPVLLAPVRRAVPASSRQDLVDSPPVLLRQLEAADTSHPSCMV